MTFNQVLKEGLIISFLSKYSSILIQLIVGILLARILTPSEFGVFAIIIVFTSFFNLISDIGIAPAIIQSKEIDDRDISNYFYFSICLGIVLSGLFVSLSVVLVNFYSNKVYFKLGSLLTITVFFSSLAIIPTSILSKRKKFKALGIIRFIAGLISGFIAVFLAYKKFSFYSLVAQSITYSVILFFGVFIFSNFIYFLKNQKTSLSKIQVSLKKIARYSSYNFAFNFINYFSRNLDNILIGRYLGTSSLGFYDKAYRLMLFPISSLNQVFSPIMHPLLSDYQDNKEFIFQTFSNMVRFLAMIGMPLTIFCYFDAKDIIVVLYGNRWINSIPIFKILSLTVWIQIIWATMGAIFLASNKPRLYFYNGLLNSSILIIGIILGIIQKDLIRLSTYLSIAYYLNFVVTLYLIMKYVFAKKAILIYFILIRPAIVGLILILLLQLNSLVKIDSIYLRVFFNLSLSLVGFVFGIYVTSEHKFLFRVITIKR